VLCGALTALADHDLNDTALLLSKADRYVDSQQESNRRGEYGDVSSRSRCPKPSLWLKGDASAHMCLKGNSLQSSLAAASTLALIRFYGVNGSAEGW